MRPRSLADELADLVSPAPRPEVDPDELALGEAAATADADDQLLGLLQQQPAQRVGAPAGLGLRGAADLALDEQYAGRRSSRAALFGDDEQQVADEEEDDPVDRYMSLPDDMEGDRQAAASPQDDNDDDDDEDDDDDVSIERGTLPYMNGFHGHTSSSSDAGSDSEGEAAQQEDQGIPQAAPDRPATPPLQPQLQQPPTPPPGQPPEQRQPQAGAADQDAEHSSEDEEEEEGLQQQQLSDDQPDEEGDGDSDQEDEEAEAAAAALADDPALRELDRQYEELQAQAAPPMALVRERAAREAAKGAAVRAQRALWERTLHLRILLQKAVAGAAALPRPEVVPLFRASQPRVDAGYQKVLDSCQGLLGDLLQLHTAAGSQHQTAAAALASGGADDQQEEQQGPGSSAAAAASGRKRSHGEASSSDQQQQPLSEALWQQVDAAVSALAPFRDAALDKWHRRTVLSSGGAALSGNSLRALQQSISKQVATMLADPGRVIRRSQLPVSIAPRPLGSVGQRSTGVGDAPVERRSAAAEERDEETYDDGDFYQQLLKELLETSGGDGARLANGGKAAKRRKLVDRRASKGRKIRYHVLDKLVNFMAPQELVPPPYAAQLFSNLFGYSQRGQQ